MSPGQGQREGDRLVRAIGMVLVATLIFPFMDGTAKLLSETYPVLQVTWARYMFHLLVLLPLVLLRYPLRALVPPNPAGQLLRALFLLGGTLTFFAGLYYLPLVDVLALSFTAPLVVTVTSPFVLGERISVRRITAATIGFIGALVILRPGVGVFEWASLFGIATGVMIAGYAMQTRRIARAVPSAIALLYTSIVGVVVMSAIVPFFWRMPDLADIGLMVFMGASAAFCHWMLILAYEQAEASLLAPFSYAELITATLIGLFLFGDFPDAMTWTGIAIVVASGLYISYQERHLGLRRVRPPETTT
ncbi:MAG: DMT family transporter [Rhodospirillaceae bacterium]|nr:DMT family transporter [Rhodospirillaceae bacterium]